MIVKLPTEHYLEFLSLKGGCRGSSESTHVKMLYCWKSHALAQMIPLGRYPMISVRLYHIIIISRIYLILYESLYYQPKATGTGNVTDSIESNE